MKVYIIMRTTGKDGARRRAVHMVYFHNLHAQTTLDKLNEHSNDERMQLARNDHIHHLEIAGRAHPIPLDALAHVHFFDVPHYELEEHEVLLKPTD